MDSCKQSQAGQGQQALYNCTELQEWYDGVSIFALLQLESSLKTFQAQVLTKFATNIWAATVEAYRRGDAGGVAHYGDALLRLIRDMDDLLATVP